MLHKGSSAIVNNCTFEGNSAVQGGAIWFDRGNLVVLNTTFRANTSESDGGAIDNEGDGELTVINSVFEANRTSGVGGAIWPGGTIVNCTFFDNTAVTAGALVRGDVVNSIFWLNNQSGAGLPTGDAQLRFSMVDFVFEGEGIVIADSPGFDDDNMPHLSARSECRDSGSTEALPADLWDLDADGDTEEPLPVDLSGSRRVAGTAVDLGAYEFVLDL